MNFQDKHFLLHQGCWMATAAPSPLASSREKTNGNKLRRLLIDGGTTVLRNIFDHYHPPANLASDLNANYSILNNLFRRRVLNGRQWNKLFPPGGGVPDSNTFDITLLFLLLTNICGLSPPLTGWHTKPPPSDNSLEANLARVKFFRNMLYGHVTSTGVDATSFSSFWQEISITLHSLGLDQAEIDRLKAERGGEQDYLDVLIEWADSEQDIKAQLTNIYQMQLKVVKALEDGALNLEEQPQAQYALSKTQDVADEAVEIELKGHQELRAVHQEYTSHRFRLVKESATDGPSTSFTRGPLMVTLVGDEWGSSKGGLSTLNRELAKHLARQSGVEVTILLPHYSEREKQEANDFQVSLATPEPMTGFDSIRGLSFPKNDHDIDVVVGHGQKLGVPAQVIAKQRRCKRVHIVHTASEELSMFKKRETALSEGEEKHRTEMNLCKEADVVLAIGPKLKEAVSANLRCYGRDEHVIDITPGIFSEFANLEQASQEREQFRILVFGCGNFEDFELKGYDVAAKAVASLKDENYLLQFVGAPKGNEEEVKNRLLKCGISRTQLIVRGFTESREELQKFLCEADLAIMPSRTEGFGLTALEALSAALPILVGSNSGFGQAIRKVKFGSASVVCSDDPGEWGKAIRHVRQKPRKLRLNEACSLRKSYDKEYKWETQCENLVDRMRQILK